MPPEVREQLSEIASRCWTADGVLYVTPDEYLLLREWAERAEEWDDILMQQYRSSLPHVLPAVGSVGIYGALKVVVEREPTL